MAIYGSPREPIEGIGNISVLARSTDGGQTWGDETLTAQGYNETSYALLPNGDLLAAPALKAATWPCCAAMIWGT
jgi:hypothetical protein